MGLLSYSQLNTFNHCGEQLRLQKLGFPEPPAVYLIGGTAFHEATEAVDRDLYNGVDVGIEEAQNYWESRWAAGLQEADEVEPDRSKWRVGGRATKANPNKDDVAFWDTLGVEMVTAYLMWRQMSDWEIYDINGEPAIEVAVTAQMGAGTVRGYIDRIFVTRHGELVIVDLKTGKEPDQALQLGTYSEGLSRTVDLHCHWGAFYMARKGEMTAVVNLDNYDTAVLVDMYSKLNTIRRLGLYIPNPGSHCKPCGVSEGCSLKGSKAHEWAGINPEF